MFGLSSSQDRLKLKELFDVASLDEEKWGSHAVRSLAVFVFFKFAATILSAACPVPAGVFTPIFVCGAALGKTCPFLVRGRLFSALLHPLRLPIVPLHGDGEDLLSVETSPHLPSLSSASVFPSPLGRRTCVALGFCVQDQPSQYGSRCPIVCSAYAKHLESPWSLSLSGLVDRYTSCHLSLGIVFA